MIQMVVDQAQRADAPGQGRQFALRFRTLGTRTLERNEAADDLEVVLHTMVNLSEQHLLLVEVGTELFVGRRSEEHTSELQSLMRISYAVFCLKKKKE